MNNDALIQKLTVMKSKVEAAKTDKAKLEGQLAGDMARLKELGFDDVDAAETRLDELHDEIARLDESLKKGVEELEEKYDL